MAASRMHMFLAAATLSYLREGATKQRQMNLVVATEERRIDLRTLEQSKLQLFQRLEDEMSVPKDDIKDFVFNSFSYLGHMSEREFEGKAPRLPQPYQA